MQTDPSLKENVTHGTKRTPITGIRFRTGAQTIYPDRFFVDLHWHHTMEIISIAKGSYLFEINLETYRLNAGDICFLNSGDLHRITGLEKNTVHNVLIFDPHILEFAYPDEVQEQIIAPFLDHERVFRNILHTQDPLHSTASLLVSRLMTHALEKKNNWYLTCKLLLLELLSTMADTGFLQQADSAWPASDKQKISRYKKIISYMEQHYSERIVLEDLASLISCNSQYLCRFFKEITGCSPIQYLIAYRIDHACTLLTDTTMSVLEISMDCGFDNVSYFIRKFRQLKGCTPNQFRLHGSKTTETGTVP